MTNDNSKYASKRNLKKKKNQVYPHRMTHKDTKTSKGLSGSWGIEE